MLLPGTGRGTATRSGVVEGGPRAALLDDSRNDTFQIAEHLCGRNSHRREAVLRQIPVPPLIPLRPISAVVRLSVNLDCDACLKTGKIQGKRPLRALLSKLEPTRPILQRPPQQPFRGAHVLAKPTRAFHRLDRRLEDTRAPSTMLRMVPLPVPGRSDSTA